MEFTVKVENRLTGLFLNKYLVSRKNLKNNVDKLIIRNLCAFSTVSNPIFPFWKDNVFFKRTNKVLLIKLLHCPRNNKRAWQTHLLQSDFC